MASFHDAAAYDAFMGRYSRLLAPLFLDRAGVGAAARVVDVGCGPGALTEELVRRSSPDRVVAVDPSSSFVAAVRERLPQVEVREATAERLPFENGTFDAALAQLVVHFMVDPVAGLREMARVARTGGVVAACSWDQGGGRAPFDLFVSVLREVHPPPVDQPGMAGTREGHMVELFHKAGFADVEEDVLTVTRTFATFEEWWVPYTLGVGPTGDRWAALSPQERDEVEVRCAEQLGPPPFDVAASAWCVVARVP